MHTAVKLNEVDVNRSPRRPHRAAQHARPAAGHGAETKTVCGTNRLARQLRPPSLTSALDMEFLEVLTGGPWRECCWLRGGGREVITIYS
ncbi:hypothetical protein CRUP_002207 [Coryphaenoides rupestris]|nr:hypothetical protein CRUP_002207 [Coryphaenoides rupestris]